MKENNTLKVNSCPYCNFRNNNTEVEGNNGFCPYCGARLSMYGVDIEVNGNNYEEVSAVSAHLVREVIAKNKIDRVLTREEYFQIILEIREVERISLDAYMQDRYDRYIGKNPDFVKILYKDINNILEGVDKECDHDLVIEDGDLVWDGDDFKLTGHPTNLHYALTWLHMQLVEEFTKKDVLDFMRKMQHFEEKFLKTNFDTPAYQQKIKVLGDELKRERNSKDKGGWTWSDLNSMVELKPNIAGIGINLNEIFSRMINRKKRPGK